MVSHNGAFEESTRGVMGEFSGKKCFSNQAKCLPPQPVSLPGNSHVQLKASAKLEMPVQVPDRLKVDASNKIVQAEIEYMASQYAEMPAFLGTASPQERQAACCANGCA